MTQAWTHPVCLYALQLHRRPSTEFSFEPVWTSPYIKDVSDFDICLLNGLAIREGACLCHGHVAVGYRRRLRMDGRGYAGVNGGRFDSVKLL